MSEKQLTLEQKNKIEQLKKEWLAEAEPYLNGQNHKKNVLDGPDSAALNKIQIKYRERIKEIMEASE